MASCEGGIELGSGPVRSVQSVDGARDESGKRAGSFPVGNTGRWAIKAMWASRTWTGVRGRQRGRRAGPTLDHGLESRRAGGPGAWCASASVAADEG